ncbi:hypothetical protein POTOM_037142 [Populus tomentosa]|uniref:Spt4/RpoE2 zinc finger domain-containing protein n=1 Tax=Populus tomentosa TaxID=118781 RepID=A0A8X7Z074_POPTO|nr:hypothetical protein POTOM_037142 [Populus tomentosa]
MGSAAAQIPTSFGHELRACLRCRLVKTYDQFRESGCENCPFFKMDEDHERVVDCTTPNFTGIISVMDPSRSWAARWLRIVDTTIVQFISFSALKILLIDLPSSPWTFWGHSITRIRLIRYSDVEACRCTQFLFFPRDGRFVPGCYTLAVSEALPEDLQNLCEDERVPYIPPKRV